jgi:tetrahydromethanopterin S-methyltransferase subunit H
MPGAVGEPGGAVLTGGGGRVVVGTGVMGPVVGGGPAVVAVGDGTGAAVVVVPVVVPDVPVPVVGGLRTVGSDWVWVRPGVGVDAGLGAGFTALTAGLVGVTAATITGLVL